MRADCWPADCGRASRQRQASAQLVTLSVAFGMVSGAVSIATGLRGHSLGVLAVGLGVLADVTLAAAAVSVLVLTPLAIGKRCNRMNSTALRGDGTLSGIGAATSFLALAALVVYQLLGWWWADRITALIVAAVAGAEAWRTVSRR
jgi:Co/Zn/Cd efflux system component